MTLSDPLKEKWLTAIGKPTQYDYEPSLQLVRKLTTPDFDGELYEQANGPGTVQKTLLMLPKLIQNKLPAVAVPFYYPDRMAGYDLDTLQPTGKPHLAMALHLVRRGYAAITAEAYHLTYCDLDLDRNDFSRWKHSGETLLKDHPQWTGIGKLLADTQLLIDALCEDSRIDSDRIGIAGHSLGGKMAFYTGCLDPRIKGMLCSDFGLEWDRTNWSEPWYWGEKLNALKKADMDHTELIQISNFKPFGLIAGLYDDDGALDLIQKANFPESQYLFINHATGHRPPIEVLEKGYEWLAQYL